LLLQSWTEGVRWCRRAPGIRFGLFFAGILLLWVAPVRSAPPDKSGVKPSVISLPTGAGSIEGLGESFEPQLNTGGSTYGVTITVPPGRAGLAPSIHLGYNSFSGNGLCGIGWSLDFMSVKRQTDKGFPEYDNGDTFEFGGEELVPLSNPEQDWRCENERTFQRLRRIDSDGDGVADAWEVTERDGTKHTLGRFRGQNNRWSVVEHPEKAAAGPFDRTYCWMLDSTTDLHGNRIEYEYELGSGVLYPSRITYAHLGNNFHEVLFLYEDRPDAFDDYRPTFSATLARRLKRIEVRSQGKLVRAYNFAYAYEPGDLTPDQAALQSTYLDLGVTLLKRVVQVDRSGSDLNYLPPLVFTYSGLDLTKAEPRDFTSAPELDLAEPNGRVQLADLDGDGLPDLFATTLEGAGNVQRVALNRGESRLSGQPKLTFAPAKLVISSSPVDMAQPNTVVHDPKGKGLVDVSSLVDQGGDKRLETFGNRARLDLVDENRLGFSQENLEATTLANPPAFVTYSDSATRQMDVNFDKRSDFVNLEPIFGAMKVNTYFIQRGGQWAAGTSLLPPSYPLANTFQGPDGQPNPCVHLADMNGDRMLDLVCLDPSPSGTGQRIHVSYWPLCARGRYGDERSMTNAPDDSFDIGTADLRDVFIEDITGDGLADVLVMDGSGAGTVMTLRVNIAGKRWSPPYTRTGLPRYAPRDPTQPTIFRLADLNANGSIDLLFRNTTPQDNWTYFELLPHGRPNLMTGIDNGLGKRTSIVYGSAAEDEQAAREAGHPWRTFAPIALEVVRQIRTSPGVDLNGDGKEDNLVMEFHYRDPYYDGFEREFRGFAFAERIDFGDDFLFDPVTGLMNVSPGWDTSRTPTGQRSGPTLVSRFRFYTGAADQQDNDDYGGQPPPPDSQIDEFTEIGGREEEALKGLLVVEEKIDPVVLHSATAADFDSGCELAATATTPEAQARLTPDAYVYTRTHQKWAMRRLYRPAEPIPYFADQNADGILEDYRSAPAVPVPAGRFASQGITVLPGNGHSVTFVFASEQTIEVHEANGLLSATLGYAPAQPARTVKSVDCDDYGNPIVTRELGLDDPDFDDERITTTTYAHGGNALSLWILDKPDTVTVTDENGAFVSKRVHFYDGDPFVGIEGGIQNRALLHRTEAYIDLNRSVPVARTRYDAYGNAEELHDPVGNIHRVTFDPAFAIYPITETMVVGGGSPDLQMQADYDFGFGVVTRSIDFNGNVTIYGYDSFARPVTLVRPGDSPELPTRIYEYEPCDPIRGRAFVYDTTGNLTVTAVPLGSLSRVTTRQREVAGQPGEFVSATYSDGSSRKVATVEKGEVPGTWVVRQATSYNLRGLPQSQWLPYRVSSVEIPQHPALWPAGRPPELDGTNQVVATDTYYDPQGREIRVVAPPETWGGERREARTHRLPFQLWTFDEEDLHLGSPSAGTPHMSYSDGLGRIVKVVDAVKMDDLGQPTAVTNYWVTRFEYDLNDRPTRITDPQGNVKIMGYDGLKRKTFVNDPDRGVMTYTYDDASNLIETRDAENQRITYTYDGLNRMRTEEYHDENSPGFSYHRSPDVAYFYDQPAGAVDQGDGTTLTARNTKGYLAYVVDTSGEEHTSYDERGRVEWTVKRLPDAGSGVPLSPTPSVLISYATRFDYDSMDRITRMRYPDNDEIAYVYNSRNLLQQIVGGPSGKIISSISYVASGQQQQIEYGNGVRAIHTYDPRLRLTDLLTLSPAAGNPELINYHYELDGVSNIKAIQDRRSTTTVSSNDRRRNTQTFTYDDLYRLTRVQYNAPAAATANGGAIDYHYDRIGNLLTQSSDIPQLENGISVTDLGALAYGGLSGSANRIGRQADDPPGPHALTQVQNAGSQTRTFPYDAKGNMTQIDGLRCTWDIKDRLVEVENDTMRTEYRYDYNDVRVLKRVWPKPATNAQPAAVGPQSSTVTYPSRHFEIRDHDEPVKYVFNGVTRVARVVGSLSDADTGRIQRLRLYPGWNLCSVAVGGARLPFDLAGAAFEWDATGNNWLPVSTSNPLPAGAVLWLYAPTNSTLSLAGSYTSPTDRSVASGPSYQPGAGLEALSLPGPAADVAIWHHTAPSQTWQTHAPAVPDPEPDSGTPAFLAPGEAVFMIAGAPLQLNVPDPALRVRYFHQDHLGSSNVVTDGNGAIVEETASHPFGTPRNAYQPRQLHEPYQFTQKERDQETGLHYFESRYLASGIGRWISCDPAGAADGLNPYYYTQNNPVRYVDPIGHDSLDPEKLKLTANMMGIDPGENFNWKTLAASGVNMEGALSAAKEAANADWERETGGGPTWHDHVKNFCAGFGDMITPFPTRSLRNAIGIEVDDKGWMYGLGAAGGFIAGMGAGALAGPKGAPAAGGPPPSALPEINYSPAAPVPRTLPGWEPPGGAFNGTAYGVARANARAAQAAENWSNAVNSSPRSAWTQATIDATRDYRYSLPSFREQADALRSIYETAEQLFSH
jgi:RHS repeat-associated protein